MQVIILTWRTRKRLIIYARILIMNLVPGLEIFAQGVVVTAMETEVAAMDFYHTPGMIPRVCDPI